METPGSSACFSLATQVIWKLSTLSWKDWHTRDRNSWEKKGDGQLLPVLIHGDAAFAGQGIVAETLNLSQIEGYSTGGTLHIVINNQIGFTTLPEHARSTRYATDTAKMLMAPIFHVHGEDPEAALHVVKLAAGLPDRIRKRRRDRCGLLQEVRE